MARVPYDQLAPEANKLFEKITSSRDLKTLRYWYEMYIHFLEGAGWTLVDYEQEELKRIDNSWTEAEN